MPDIAAKVNILNRINGYQNTCLIVAANEIGPFSALFAGPMTVKKLVRKLEIEPHLLFRFARALESLQLLCITDEDVVLSKNGQLLAADESSLSSIPIDMLNTIKNERTNTF